MNFKDVSVTSSSTQVLLLKNHSNVPVRYHIMMARHSVFHLSHVSGIIPPLLESSVMVTFSPDAPGNFYRRLFCLVQDQSTIFLDILGTGYDHDVRPAPFQQAHVDAYRFRRMHQWYDTSIWRESSIEKWIMRSI